MITASELTISPVLAKADPVQLAIVAAGAADLRLAAAEYAVHEGDERALYVVLEGNIEVTKLFDGIERLIGKRAPGQIFGEIPIVFGIPFQGNYRAAGPARVARIEPAHFHALAAVSPEALTGVAAIARERLGGLQGFAANPGKSRATLVGHDGDPACRALRTFLTRNQIRFEWLKPDAPDLGARWPGAPLTPDDLPALHCDDGSTLTRAQNREVAQRLGLQTGALTEAYDTVVIGAGPAGLAAAVYGASEGLRTLVVEPMAPGGQAGSSSRIENYLGFPAGITGSDLGRRAHTQASRFGAEFVTQRAVGLRIDGQYRFVQLSDGREVSSHVVLLAPGVQYRKLGIPGSDRLTGRGIYYGAALVEATSCKDEEVFVVGGAN